MAIFAKNAACNFYQTLVAAWNLKVLEHILGSILLEILCVGCDLHDSVPNFVANMQS